MRRKKNKIGDRIFLEDLNGEVFDCIVQDIEPRTYEDNGKVTHFNMLHTGKYTMTEDYNCLSERDPRVVEYKKTHADPRGFIEKFEEFMKKNNFNISQASIQDYLSELLF